jgi:hypothetical protein
LRIFYVGSNIARIGAFKQLIQIKEAKVAPSLCCFEVFVTEILLLSSLNFGLFNRIP